MKVLTFDCCTFLFLCIIRRKIHVRDPVKTAEDYFCGFYFFEFDYLAL